MADASLDDFFAKKDKRTKKSKGKLTPTELLVKQESEQQKSQKKKKDKDKSQNRQTQSSSTTGTSTAVAQEDQEWKEFEEETEKDYTGLRIQNLQISKEEEDEESDKRDSDDDGEREEGKDRRDGKEGPGRCRSLLLNLRHNPLLLNQSLLPRLKNPKQRVNMSPHQPRYAATASATAPTLTDEEEERGAQPEKRGGFPHTGRCWGRSRWRWRRIVPLGG
ncbi:protein CDV3 homolog A-like [Liolophura sinensis]|uniref:protein CDV3 homolog A-like n=1 Tax=Liolophura sinensis TaxID=3198878 RepID=UPI0031587D81